MPEAEPATKHVTPQGTVSYTKGAVVQDAGTQFAVKKTILKTYQIVWYILGAIEVLLAFRFILRLLGANPSSGFAQLIYDLSAPFVSLFWGLFGATPSYEGITVEWTTLVAMVVYLVIAWGIVQLLQIMKPVTPTEVEQKVD